MTRAVLLFFSAMEYRSLNLSDIPRRWHLAPKVIAICFTEYTSRRPQRILDLQIALHLRTTPERSRFRIDGRDYQAAAPHLLVKRPGNIIEYGPSSGFSIYFKYATNDAPDLPPDLFVEELHPSSALSDLAHQLHTLCGRAYDDGVADRIDALCLQLLTEELCAVKTCENPPRNPQILKVASWIMAQPPAKLLPDAVAQRFGLSRRTLDRQWRQVFHKSFGQSIIDLKITEAKHLLLDTTQSITAIALALGYKESTNFATTFRRATGMTPKAYRLGQTAFA